MHVISNKKYQSHQKIASFLLKYLQMKVLLLQPTTAIGCISSQQQLLFLVDTPGCGHQKQIILLARNRGHCCIQLSLESCLFKHPFWDSKSFEKNSLLKIKFSRGQKKNPRALLYTKLTPLNPFPVSKWNFENS